MPLKPLNVPGLLEKAETLNNTMTLHHTGNNFIFGKIDNRDMDALFQMLESHLPEEDKPIERYMHEGDTGDCHCTLFDYHQADADVLARIDACDTSFDFKPIHVSKFVEQKYGKHKVFYCVGLSSPSLIQWLEDNDLLQHMNKNLAGSLHYTIAEASWKGDIEDAPSGEEHQQQPHRHHHSEDAGEQRGLQQACTLCLPKPFGPATVVKVSPGQPLQLKWHHSHGDEGEVRLQYAVNCWGSSLTPWSVIAERAPNTGSFEWVVPEDAEPDTRYYVRMTHWVDSSLQVDSDYFEVTAR